MDENRSPRVHAITWVTLGLLFLSWSVVQSTYFPLIVFGVRPSGSPVTPSGQQFLAVMMLVLTGSHIIWAVVAWTSRSQFWRLSVLSVACNAFVCSSYNAFDMYRMLPTPLLPFMRVFGATALVIWYGAWPIGIGLLIRRAINRYRASKSRHTPPDDPPPDS